VTGIARRPLAFTRPMRATSFCVLLLGVLTLHGCSKGPSPTGRAVSRNLNHLPVALPASSAASDASTSKLASTATDEPLSLQAARYRLTLVADRGSRKGATSEGALTLVQASATDKSSMTGNLARDFDTPPAFYGWAKLDFRKIAAPLCNGPPDPDSRDPARPGALVPGRRFRGQQMILIGTMWNLRDGQEYRDGCGIALSIESSIGGCYSGIWNRWGIVGNGSGSFRACSVPN
jgi:hypothetical protein